MIKILVKVAVPNTKKDQTVQIFCTYFETIKINIIVYYLYLIIKVIQIVQTLISNKKITQTYHQKILMQLLPIFSCTNNKL